MVNATQQKVPFIDIYYEAIEAGRKAAENCEPYPMVVGDAKNILSDEIDYDKPVHYVNEGLCGFAWVWFPDARRKFNKWLVDRDYGRVDSYEGGVKIWGNTFWQGQSIERKEAGARAAKKVFEAHGIKCYVGSRLD